MSPNTVSDTQGVTRGYSLRHGTEVPEGCGPSGRVGTRATRLRAGAPGALKVACLVGGARNKRLRTGECTRKARAPRLPAARAHRSCAVRRALELARELTHELTGGVGIVEELVDDAFVGGQHIVTGQTRAKAT